MKSGNEANIATLLDKSLTNNLCSLLTMSILEVLCMSLSRSVVLCTTVYMYIHIQCLLCVQEQMREDHEKELLALKVNVSRKEYTI